jgi:hypothetical protein
LPPWQATMIGFANGQDQNERPGRCGTARRKDANRQSVAACQPNGAGLQGHAG